MQEVLQEKTIAEKRENTCNEIDIAKMKVDFARIELIENFKDIDTILQNITQTKKAISCLRYLNSNWQHDTYSENQLKIAEKRLEDYSNLYEKAILKRKILKAKLKQAQRKLSKKQKSIIRFDKKYYSKNQ